MIISIKHLPENEPVTVLKSKELICMDVKMKDCNDVA